MAKKSANPEAVGAREIFGVTALSTNNCLAAIFMSSLFMQYMTDYAGLGSWGATLATILLFVARIIDVVDDPVQGFILDSAKPGKHGKYKPFFMLSIIMTALGVIMLYSLPAGVASKPVLVTVWVIFFYLVFDIGSSFYNQTLMFRAMTNDINERTKLVIGPRLWGMVLGIVGAAFVALAVAINTFTHSYNKAFCLLAVLSMGVATVLSVIGWFICKEKHVVEPDEEDKVKISDFFELFKVNKAMVVHVSKCLFTGFIWTMLFATPSYYVKWGLCADLTTGQVDMSSFAIYSAIVSMMMLVPLLLGTLTAGPIMKKLGDNPIRLTKLNLVLQALGGLLLFAAQMLGFMSPIVFFGGMFLMAYGIGNDFVPQSTVEMEIMDYTLYKTGKDRSALSGVVNRFLEKAQTAVSSALVGVILIAIGYEVDSVSGDFTGNLANMPTMLNWFIVVMGLVPAVFAVIGILILGKYPIDDKERADMREFLDHRND